MHIDLELVRITEYEGKPSRGKTFWAADGHLMLSVDQASWTLGHSKEWEVKIEIESHDVGGSEHRYCITEKKATVRLSCEDVNALLAFLMREKLLTLTAMT